MELFKTNSKIDFMKQRKWAAAFSVLLFIFSLTSFVINGLNLGLDFTGGHQFILSYPTQVDFNKVRDSLEESGFDHAIVQAYGSSKQVMIKLPPQDKVSQKQVKADLAQVLPDGKIMQAQYIGPQVGKKLMTNGVLAIIVSLIGTMLYVAMRFEYRFAVSATVAMIHDPVLVLGIFSYFHVTFDLVALAAVLTVIGYSLNDTIVVYDRIRENFRRMRKATPLAITNASINETLSRTILTSGLTLIAVTSLLIFGGETLRGFALAMAIGILVGTYSSIYVAGALAVALGLNRQSLLPPEREVDNSP